MFSSFCSRSAICDLKGVYGTLCASLVGVSPRVGVAMPMEGGREVAMPMEGGGREEGGGGEVAMPMEGRREVAMPIEGGGEK